MELKKSKTASNVKAVSGKKVRPEELQALRKSNQPLYSTRALQSLRKSLKIIYHRKGYKDEVADTIFNRLTTNMRLLERLHTLSRKVLSGDEEAAQKFYRHINDLSGRFEGQGSARILLGRVDLGQSGLAPRSILAPQRLGINAQGGPCGDMLNLHGMAELYGAVWAVYAFNLGDLTQPPSNELPQALDTVAGLSLGHGHLEVLHNRFQREGIDGLTEAVEWGEASGNPYFAPVSPGQENTLAGRPLPPPDTPQGRPLPPHAFGDRGNPVGFTPDPGNPGHGPFEPPGANPPFPDDCEGVRESCEGILIDIFNRGAPAMPPQTRATWANNIDYIEQQGQCAGDTIIIHGHDFGAAQPDNVQLVMKIDGVCEEVTVPPQNWSNNRIEVTLPPGVSPGPIGFYNPTDDLSRDLYNGWVGRVNNDLRNINLASRCLGTPFDFPLLSPRTGVSKCAPETEVNLIQAGLPVIQSFKVNIEEGPDNLVVAEPDNELILSWQVENASTLQLRRVSTMGPNFAGSNTLANPPGISYNLGPAGHAVAAIFHYRLTAINSCGTVTADVQVYASKRPGLAVEAIEVTQGIQTMDHNVRLIKHKPTVIRVYASHDLDGFIPNDTVPGLRGRMRIHKESGWVTPWYDPINGADVQAPDPPLPNAAASIDLPGDIDRTQTNDTLNFLIPAGFCEGTIGIEVEIRVDNFGAPPGESGIDERVVRTFEDFTFSERKPLKIRYIPALVNLGPDNTEISVMTGFSNPPTDQECRDFLSEAFKYFPSTPESIDRLEGHQVTLEGGRVVITTDFGTFPIDLGVLPISTESIFYDVHANTILEWYGVLKGCDFLDVTGFVCPDNDDEIWVILAPVTGVWGRAHWSASVCISPMRQVSTAHEIAHTLNQHHITPAACPGGGSAVGMDPTSNPATWVDGGAIDPEKIVPFDTIRNRTITGGNAGVWDLMTYCGTRWTHAQRWDMLFDEIGD